MNKYKHKILKIVQDVTSLQKQWVPPILFAQGVGDKTVIVLQ